MDSPPVVNENDTPPELSPVAAPEPEAGRITRSKSKQLKIPMLYLWPSGGGRENTRTGVFGAI